MPFNKGSIPVGDANTYICKKRGDRIYGKFKCSIYISQQVRKPPKAAISQHRYKEREYDRKNENKYDRDILITIKSKRRGVNG